MVLAKVDVLLAQYIEVCQVRMPLTHQVPFVDRNRNGGKNGARCFLLY